MKNLILTIAALLPFGVAGQSLVERVDADAERVEAMPLRTEFVSFDMREYAEKNDRARNKYYVEPDDSGTIDIPVLWLDREFFLHVEGVDSATLTVNGERAAELSMSPQEVNITRYITDGENRIGFDDVVGTPRAYVYSQPKIRVEDFIVDAGADSLYKFGVLRLDVALANGYNFPESVNIGYDIYDPAGKLLNYDARDVVVGGNGRDTVRFEAEIYGMPANFWTAARPRLHKVMIVVKHGTRYTEYIPLSVGFGRTEVADGRLMRNGKAVDIEAVRYNAAADRKSTETRLAALKKKGYNTVLVDGPQPYWFYDLTDRVGLYVFDRPETGADANDPLLAGEYLMRAKAMFARGRNHVSIAGWSLGAPHGNGYNLYKTYRRLRADEPRRPVIYDGAAGEWNSDMAPIEADDD